MSALGHLLQDRSRRTPCAGHVVWLLLLCILVTILVCTQPDRSPPIQWTALWVDPRAACGTTSGQAERSPPANTRGLVRRILNNLKLPPEAVKESRAESNSSGTLPIYRPYGTPQHYDPWAPYDFSLALEAGWGRDKIVECIRTLGPYRRITFAGDSVFRNIYSQNILGRLQTAWPHNESLLWEMQRHDMSVNPAPAVHTTVGRPEGDAAGHFDEAEGGSKSQVRLSFRFLVNAYPASVVALRDALDSDVLVLNSGLWDMMEQSADLRFVRKYMYRLSHLVAWLQTNFRGRVIWQQTTAVVPAWLDEGRQKTLVESKIRTFNLFAEKLFVGAGYEVVDAYAATLSLRPELQGITDGYHPAFAFNEVLLHLIFNQVCQIDTTDFGLQTACEIIDEIDREEEALGLRAWEDILDISTFPPDLNVEVERSKCSTRLSMQRHV